MTEVGRCNNEPSVQFTYYPPYQFTDGAHAAPDVETRWRDVPARIDTCVCWTHESERLLHRYELSCLIYYGFPPRPVLRTSWTGDQGDLTPRQRTLLESHRRSFTTGYQKDLDEVYKDLRKKPRAPTDDTVCRHAFVRMKREGIWHFQGLPEGSGIRCSSDYSTRPPRN